MRLLALLAAVLLPRLATGSPIAVAARPFHNGGFEAGSFAGWTVAAPFSVVMDQAYDGFTARVGSHYALLGPRGALGTLSQSFADTPGEALRLSFWLASDGGAANAFSVAFDGATLFSLTDAPASGWRLYSTAVLATGLDTLTFSVRNDPGYFALDAVRLRPAPRPEAAVPEPSTASLGCAALALVALARAGRRAGRAKRWA